MRHSTLLLVAAALAVSLPLSSQAQRNRVSSQFPVYDNGGLPDLTMDPKRFASQLEIIDRYFDPVDDECIFDEYAVGGSGYRRLLRFDTVVLNMGDGDLVVGDRSDPENPYADWFYLAECHGHYHIRDFSVYQLFDLEGNEVARGQKQGFCFEDSFKYESGKSSGYNCDNQGITSGWGDWYYKQLPGQWIDITGVPEGDYVVRVTLNYAGRSTKARTGIRMWWRHRCMCRTRATRWPSANDGASCRALTLRTGTYDRENAPRQRSDVRRGLAPAVGLHGGSFH